MSERKFKFVSPGVFIREIDNSQLAKSPADVGPVIIGRTHRGPAMRPIRVSSLAEYVEIFGNPVAGGDVADAWRTGTPSGPTYAAYAAQAWLKNNNSATIVRLLGTEHSDAAAAGKAGWETSATAPNLDATQNGGAFGIFVVDSGSYNTNVKKNLNMGVLAAILYADTGTYFTLSGASPNQAHSNNNAAAQYIESRGNKEFILNVRNGSDSEMIKFNFTEGSPYYIRRVLNTNPTKTNSAITTADSLAKYWLGETFDGMLSRYVSGSTAGKTYAFIAALHDSTQSVNHGKHRIGATPSRTGFVISQDTSTATGSYKPTSMQKLFRFISRDSGEYEMKNFKISIQDIKRSTNLDNPYGTFTVVLRHAKDNDNRPQIIERFSGCNLNPNSVDYVARKIGDMFVEFNDTDRRLRHKGTYPNNSKYIRVEMNQAVDVGSTEPELLPFGFEGPPRYVRFAVSGGVGSANVFKMDRDGTVSDTEPSVDSGMSTFNPLVGGSGSIPTVSLSAELTTAAHQSHLRIIDALVTPDASGAADPGFLHTFLMPAPLLRISASDGNPSSKENTYFGITTSKEGSTAFDPSYVDTVRMLASDYISDGDASDTESIETSYHFSLDELAEDADTSVVYYLSGSRAAGNSYRGQDTIAKVLETGQYDRFTMPLYGGFDGFDITEKEPFRNTGLDGVSSTPKELYSYVYNSVKRALDTVADPEFVEMNLLTMPGIRDDGLTQHALDICEDRGDALAIIDLKGDYVAAEENTSAHTSRVGDVDTTISNLRDRALNTSYGCAFYPWVQIRDPEAGNFVWVPPSVAALGTFASSERRSELWFAPAGFNRGGLTNGAAGIPVVGITERLTSKDRDKLYDANINPIATFPNEGIVIFGQKTLQVTPSALDRINVRRMMIFVKKQISRFAAGILFDQNVQSTWNRFLGKVEPFLRSVKTRFGLSDFRVILDETTTTPDLVDRNILYAKIFLKPARAIEFIALDFTISSTGASFDD